MTLTRSESEDLPKGRGLGAPRKADDEVLAAMIARGATHAQTAQALGISTRTVSRRRREPHIAASIRASRADAVQELAGRMVAMAARALDVLDDQLDSDDERHARASAIGVLDRVLRAVDAANQLDRSERELADQLQRRPATAESWPGWEDENTLWTIADTTIDPWAAAHQAIAERRWSWCDIRVLVGHTDLQAARRRIATAAHEVAARRADGTEPEAIDGAFDAAVLIASYRPDEELPVVLMDGDAVPLTCIIDEEVVKLAGSVPSSPTFGEGIVAACLKLSLGTPDGIELRRRIWNDGHDVTESPTCQK